MPNVAIQEIMQIALAADGRPIAQPRVPEALTEFIYPLRALRPQTAGLVSVSGAELTRFITSAAPRENQPVASVTRALHLEDDSWLLVPDDDERGPDSDPTLQFFEFREWSDGVLLVPMVVDLTIPSGSRIADFLAQASVTSLWRNRRRSKETAICVDTDTGDCFGERCGSGCSKLTWGPPDAPSWSCICPDHA